MDFGFLRRRRFEKTLTRACLFLSVIQLLFDVSARKERDTGRCSLASFSSLSIGLLISNIDVYSFGASIHVGRENRSSSLIGLALHSGDRLATNALTSGLTDHDVGVDTVDIDKGEPKGNRESILSLD